MAMLNRGETLPADRCTNSKITEIRPRCNSFSINDDHITIGIIYPITPSKGTDVSEKHGPSQIKTSPNPHVSNQESFICCLLIFTGYQEGLCIAGSMPSSRRELCQASQVGEPAESSIRYRCTSDKPRAPSD